MKWGDDVLVKQPARKAAPKTFLLFTSTGRIGSGKTNVWIVRDEKWHMTLGTIRWYGPWRQYVFAPEAATIYSAGCLDEIAAFIRNQVTL